MPSAPGCAACRKGSPVQPFEYCRPASVAEALALLREGVDAKLLAGGQSLLASMKLGLMAPERLIDIARLPDLRSLELSGGRLQLGAMLSHGELAAALRCATSRRVWPSWPAISPMPRCAAVAPWAAPWPMPTPPPAGLRA